MCSLFDRESRGDERGKRIAGPDRGGLPLSTFSVLVLILFFSTFATRSVPALASLEVGIAQPFVTSSSTVRSVEAPPLRAKGPVQKKGKKKQSGKRRGLEEPNDKPVQKPEKKRKTGKKQDSEDPLVPCRYCNNHGWLPCKKHSKQDRKLEDEDVVIYCSKAVRCKTCAGTMAYDCPRCENPHEEDSLAADRKRNLDWLKRRVDKVEKLIKHKVLHLTSEHFDLVFDLKPMKVGKVKYNTHRLGHLYLKRLEEFRALFVKTLQLKRSDLPNRTAVYMWRDGRDQALAALKFADMGASGAGVKLMGVYSIYTMQYQKRYMRTDADLHRNVVHNVCHLLMSNIIPQQWVGQLKAGWMDVGLAHYFEFKLDEKCTNFCYQEQANNVDFKNGKWLVPVRKMVALKKKFSFAEIIGKNTDQIEAKEHALSFSWVHFLMEGDFTEKGHGALLTRAIRMLKAKKPTRVVLREVYKMTVFSFEEKWRDWVLRTYPEK